MVPTLVPFAILVALSILFTIGGARVAKRNTTLIALAGMAALGADIIWHLIGYVVSGPAVLMWSSITLVTALLVSTPVCMLTAGVILIIRRRRRIRPGCCLRCGYDLTGNTSGVCSECGLAKPPPATV